eukprot:CAMPEP_0174252536 /NCGR_PEP_ID=MMETSP0439-20130205/1965_1 /TAXON_ID=0 /ORGANISM="Stereomyxa ramosa, Strain Chinc5" /LENGTH=659 /DNA_ID=CAMNT_0015333089 /DNA_START=232 /DNA_END=2211 /DNA_ORIENTATION=-
MGNWDSESSGIDMNDASGSMIALPARRQRGNTHARSKTNDLPPVRRSVSGSSLLSSSTIRSIKNARSKSIDNADPLEDSYSSTSESDEVEILTNSGKILAKSNPDNKPEELEDMPRPRMRRSLTDPGSVVVKPNGEITKRTKDEIEVSENENSEKGDKEMSSKEKFKNKKKKSAPVVSAKVSEKDKSFFRWKKKRHSLKAKKKPEKKTPDSPSVSHPIMHTTVDASKKVKDRVKESIIRAVSENLNETSDSEEMVPLKGNEAYEALIEENCRLKQENEYLKEKSCTLLNDLRTFFIQAKSKNIYLEEENQRLRQEIEGVSEDEGKERMKVLRKQNRQTIVMLHENWQLQKMSLEQEILELREKLKRAEAGESSTFEDSGRYLNKNKKFEEQSETELQEKSLDVETKLQEKEAPKKEEQTEQNLETSVNQETKREKSMREDETKKEKSNLNEAKKEKSSEAKKESSMREEEARKEKSLREENRKKEEARKEEAKREEQKKKEEEEAKKEEIRKDKAKKEVSKEELKKEEKKAKNKESETTEDTEEIENRTESQEGALKSSSSSVLGFTKTNGKSRILMMSPRGKRQREKDKEKEKAKDKDKGKDKDKEKDKGKAQKIKETKKVAKKPAKKVSENTAEKINKKPPEKETKLQIDYSGSWEI